jgi:Uma2 family endonuclease
VRDAAGVATIQAMDRAIRPPAPRYQEERDQIVVIGNVPWSQYESLLRTRGEQRRPRYAYLDGVLEIMTTSLAHELDKKLLARLLEIFALETRVELIGAGETTWRRKAKKAGAEADECYFIDKVKGAPQLAVEVVHTSGGIDKLEVYRRLGVCEVWFWISGRFWLYTLVDGTYEEIRASRLLPDFDFDTITHLLMTRDDDAQTETVRRYRASLRRR